MISAVRLAALLDQPEPTPQQVAVIEAPLGPTVVIAGAGSGKTETMAARVVWLIANKQLAPEAVLGLTFTRKAADELGQRIRRRLRAWRTILERDEPHNREQLVALLAAEPTVLTYDAYAGRLVSEHAMRVGAEPRPRLLSQAACWQLADAVARRHPEPLPSDIGVLSSVVRYVLGLSGQCADHLVSVDELERFGADAITWWDSLPAGGRSLTPGDTGRLVAALSQRQALVPLVRAYDEARRAIPAVNFGDQLTVAARLAAVGEVRRIERARYAAVLLDEYQDTGHAQIAMLRGLFADGHPVTAVGDPFQSIYGWRGASAGNIGRFAETFPGAARHPLPTSWRNDQLILRAANAVAAPLRAVDPGSVELQPRPDAGPGRISMAVTETDQDEAAWIASKLRQYWDGQPVGARTAAVLVRRRTQIPAIHQALLRVGLPVEVVDLGGLLSTPEVVDLVSTLRVLADVSSGPSLARLLTGARWRIGPRDLAALSARARRLARSRQLPSTEGDVPDSVDSGSLVEALDDLGRADAYSAAGYLRLRALSEELRGLRTRLSAPLPDLVADVERTIGVDVEVAARPDRGSSARAHLDRFLDESSAFAADADEATLGAFLAFLAAAEEEENGLTAGEVEVAPERVQMLTVHGAKGLEWDAVVVPGLVDGVFPSLPRGIDWTRSRELLPTELRGDRADLPALPLARATDRQDVGALLRQHADAVKARHRYEERRLAYVAVTRARSLLLASGYAWDLTKTARDPSSFLVELHEFADVDGWFVPEPEAVNPQLIEVRKAPWPAEPLGGRRADVETGAALVRAAQAASTAGADGAAAGGAGQDLAPGPDSAALRLRAAEWRQAVDVLLAERDRLARSDVIEVDLPAQLSVSQLVALHADPDGLARRLRRPLPARPAPLARRGTAFHAWLEQRWSAQALIDIDELPGAADQGATDTDDLDELRAAFERSEWADRVPAEVEVPFEMAIGVTVVRGRMDAVFADGEGWTVVDWKTGARPQGRPAAAAAVQLAAYRLAWADLVRADLASVGAAFHYVRSNETVRPTDLLDAEGLRRLITGGA